MRYAKHISDEYIVGVGTGNGGTEITREEYDEILTIIAEQPTPREGFGYLLRTDLTWEEYELPPVEDPDPVEEAPTTEEMMEAIQEGVNAI